MSHLPGRSQYKDEPMLTVNYKQDNEYNQFCKFECIFFTNITHDNNTMYNDKLRYIIIYYPNIMVYNGITIFSKQVYHGLFSYDE